MALWEAWEERAEAWIEWARRPHHDGFWDATWPELQAILPTEQSVIIEIGCGEGRNIPSWVRRPYYEPAGYGRILKLRHSGGRDPVTRRGIVSR